MHCLIRFASARACPGVAVPARSKSISSNIASRNPLADLSIGGKTTAMSSFWGIIYLQIAYMLKTLSRTRLEEVFFVLVASEPHPIWPPCRFGSTHTAFVHAPARRDIATINSA